MEWSEKGEKTQEWGKFEQKGLVRRTEPGKARTSCYGLKSCSLFSKTKHKWGMCCRDGTMNAFTVCLSVRGLLLAAGEKPGALSEPMSQLILSWVSLLWRVPWWLLNTLPVPTGWGDFLRERKQDIHPGRPNIAHPLQFLQGVFRCKLSC